MISLFKEGDEVIWIPVAKGKSGGPARAFLPFNGLLGNYRYGYKAAPSRGQYFNALRMIQQAFIDNENKIFRVNEGQQEERQWKARWRHGGEERAPLLAPTRGWVLVSLAALDKLSDYELGRVLDDAGEDYAELLPATAAPVLCENQDELEQESARLFHKGKGMLPAGQSTPARREHATEQFVRDAEVVAYVLLEANGMCECCLQPAPFTKPNGLPYLEVHHLRRLASGGSDKISNAVGVCPNCHRELHYGANSEALAERLLSRIERLVRE